MLNESIRTSNGILVTSGYYHPDPKYPGIRLYLGPDRKGKTLEIASIICDDREELVFHAMEMRHSYMKLLARNKRAEF